MEQLQRTVFETDRSLEYFSQKEMRSQIGHDVNFWPVVILRELIDNALDACETKQITPVIELTLKDDIITVSDNGPGIPAAVIEKSLDYLKRVSDKAYYISPTRGQMGNALKVIYAVPFVANPENPGFVEIASNGELHTIKIKLDLIAGRPDINHTITDFVRNDSFVRIYYPNSASLLYNKIDSLLTNEYDYQKYYAAPEPSELIEGYAAFNPHATFILNGIRYEATAPTWKKWLPTDPTSAHWYNIETLSDLIKGYLTKERNNGQHKKTVREFVSEFSGLTSTAKGKKIAANFQRADISIFERSGDIDRDQLRQLLQSMQTESIAPKPKALGIIGEDHFKNWILQRGGIEQSIKYIKKTGIDNGLPYVLEIGFAVNDNPEASQIKTFGLNWSPVIGDAPDPTVRSAIQTARIDSHDAVIFILHIVRPRFDFMDRGKTKIELSGTNLKADLTKGIENVTKDWKKEKLHKERISRSQHRNFYRVRNVSVKEIAFRIMQSAYNEASSNGQYYANARQIMYKARPMILKYVSKDLGQNFAVYFTQTLLKDFIELYEPAWKIVWDARGHFIEPHTGEKIGLGGIEVDKYVRNWHDDITKFRPSVNRDISTSGPQNRYKNVLFIEKEGFTEILQDAGFPERYDMALMSTKGVPVKAACDLLYRMKHSFDDIKIFVLHDFDLAGFKILKSLENGVRLSVGTEVIDLGFRLSDVKDLESEPVSYDQQTSPVYYLRSCGVSEDEIKFLVESKGYKNYDGQRVELNAMTSEQLITWLDKKLVEYGATKYIPEAEAINTAYDRARYLIEIERQINKIKVDQDKTAAPPDLTDKIKERLTKNNSLTWDQALWKIVEENEEDL